MVVVGGRAPANRWGSGSLQELDQPPIVAPVTKSARTLHTAGDVLERDGRGVRAAGVAAPRPGVRRRAHGRVLQLRRRRPAGRSRSRRGDEPDGDAITEIAELLAARHRPVLILGTDVWADGAEEAALRFVESAGIPTITNGMGRGLVPGGHPLLVTKARGQALGGSDLVVVVGTPLDFRLGYGVFGGKDGATPGAGRARRRLPGPGLRPRRARRLGRRRPDLGVRRPARPPSSRSSAAPTGPSGSTDLQAAVKAATENDAALLGAEADPIHPARIYGELVPRLAEDAVVIGDGGDFVSFAGKFVEPKRPGGWLDPGPYGCLGAGLGAAIAARIARPSSQVVLLLGDGAAGFSLMDVDTLVRHDLPVVMVMGNNSAWGLEKGPMQMLYGYDVVADLAPAHAVRRGRPGPRRRRRDGHRPAPDRAGARPRLRRERALPRQRHHRRRGGLPAQHLRDLTVVLLRRATPEDHASRSASSPWRRTPSSLTGPADGYVEHLRDAADPRPRGGAVGGRRRRRR